MLLVIWLSVPQCSGAVFIYRFYVNGLFRAHEKDLDSFINNFKIKLKESLGRYYELANGENQINSSNMNESKEMTGIKSTIKQFEYNNQNNDIDSLVDDIDVEDSNMTLIDSKDEK
ncbi:hypothetical protein NAPIS_ORF00636 [Vairimorpha apis BRL 01]|uniref:Uncharacterized protein n=1 Tax=Vairimorpha apis BRL 01 TaxID=1037528 RepID=T0L2L1_9MICR|nr:hypothetical protein NAPIS_ORF00636 [Vairimorpha apis BRL 01]